jgi:uncharacterized protein YdcH (DUF465 family)
MPDRDALREELLSSDQEFRRLFEEHQDCERRLEALRQKTMLSQEEELELKQIKVHKLALKDRMEVLLRSHREANVSA